MKKHTTGTWSHSEVTMPTFKKEASQKFANSLFAFGADGNPNNNSKIAIVYGPTEEKAAANAKLMAAAPQMLEALLAVQKRIGEFINMSEAAIDPMEAWRKVYGGNEINNAIEAATK